MGEARIKYPRGLTTKQARRLSDIGDALAETFGDVELIQADLYDFSPAPRCEGCGCELEAGHCYCCFPVFGYGEKWQDSRHGEGFRPVFRKAGS